MKKLFLLRFSVAAFFCMLCVLSSLAANIKVKGAVKDKLSKEPLIGATIRLIGTQAGAVTDMDGNFELNAGGVLEGMYDIEIKYVGYKTEVRRKVRVENGKLVILNLELETDAQELADVVVVAKKNRENEKYAAARTAESRHCSAVRRGEGTFAQRGFRCGRRRNQSIRGIQTRRSEERLCPRTGRPL